MTFTNAIQSHGFHAVGHEYMLKINAEIRVCLTHMEVETNQVNSFPCLAYTLDNDNGALWCDQLDNVEELNTYVQITNQIEETNL